MLGGGLTASDASVIVQPHFNKTRAFWNSGTKVDFCIIFAMAEAAAGLYVAGEVVETAYVQ